MVTSVQSVEALPINRSLIGTLITHQGCKIVNREKYLLLSDIVDYVRTEGQKPSREEAEPSYFCAHRTCFGGVTFSRFGQKSEMTTSCLVILIFTDKSPEGDGSVQNARMRSG